MRIRIMNLPRGEAPEEVRRAWIGLILPLEKGFSGPTPFKSMGGVLTCPRSPWIVRLRSWLGIYRYRIGYLVPGAQALEILEKSSPESARWWRENTPDLFLPDRVLVFSLDECERVKT